MQLQVIVPPVANDGVKVIVTAAPTDVPAVEPWIVMVPPPLTEPPEILPTVLKLTLLPAVAESLSD